MWGGRSDGGGSAGLEGRDERGEGGGGGVEEGGEE